MQDVPNKGEGETAKHQKLEVLGEEESRSQWVFPSHPTWKNASCWISVEINTGLRAARIQKNLSMGISEQLLITRNILPQTTATLKITV